MLTRLANVIYWAACALAALVFAVCAWVLFMSSPTGDERILAPFGMAMAVVVWLVGRAVLYVLAGR